MGTEHLVKRFATEDVGAVVLSGSFARGDQQRLSDVDLMLFASSPGDPHIEQYVIEGRLHIVSCIPPSSVDDWFTHPKLASEIVRGLRTAKILFERNETFSRIQRRAQSFTWDAEMQAKADAWASDQMAKLVEEVQKGLSGLESGHVGRLLNARFGLSWGLSQVVQVQRGVLLSGDNAFFDEVEAAANDDEWIELRRRAFSAHTSPPLSLTEQVTAGLQLFGATARLLGSALQPRDKPVIEHARRLLSEASLI